ncbi:hypothetical protein OSB04_006915 [Centaurea solstitialis]|uniref:Reverse transcriptase domain-containing protein n=1 Tax=Centaurea solstitialis TaxID=347529 RepID=A0AA38WQK0_9ASTR|nr:hypothetical protein OSB04_006915 [Centaurea solstitialis]
MDAMDQLIQGCESLSDSEPPVIVTDLGSDEEDQDAPNTPTMTSNEPMRISVFARLETDERLKIKENDLNFAKAVGNAESTALSFFPLASKVQSCIAIPKELASEVMKTHRSTLYGYFLGPRLHFPVVERYAKAAWGKYGFCEAMMNNNGIYFFKFNDYGGSNQVVEAGPLMIRGVPLFVEHWDPIKGLTKPVHNTCPLWVKLHDIPLVAFNKEGISRIASALGVPKQMDACTASMCDKAWGRPGFAKVLIETWAVGELKKELQVVIPSLVGGEDARVIVKVEYLWEPSQCSHCLVFGHKTTSCAKAVSAQIKKGKNKMVDDDGFTKVQRKEWRPKSVGSTSGTKDNQQLKINDEPPRSIGTISGTKEDQQPSLEVVNDKDTTLNDQSVENQKEARDVIGSPSGDVLVGKNVANKPSLEKAIVKPVVQHFTAPLDKPLKSILKKNRFSPLGEEAVHKEEKDLLPDVCKAVFGSWRWISNSQYTNGGTRIIFAWDESQGDVMLVDSHSQYMHCFVKMRGDLEGFFITIVYGANDIGERKQLWSNLRKAKDVLDEMLVWRIFFACVEDIEVIDVPYTGVNYTWTQKPSGGDGLHRKLDRIMANTDFLSKFDGSMASFNPRGISDHAVGILQVKCDKRKRNTGFKFDNFVVENDDFLKVVEWEWHQPLACDLDPTNPDLLEDLAHYYLAYEKALLDEDSYLRQRAKVKWIRDGDRNTKFFHHVVKEKKGRNFIRAIAGPDGNFVYDDAVGELFLDHFRTFLGLQDMNSLHMIRPITDEEIKNALYQIGNDKAPGSDGFSSKFFKSAWHIVGEDVQIAIHNFFYSGRMVKEINHTLLCFIPKIPNATRVSDFRPISCCSVLYKVISKIISDRIKPFLGCIVGPTQSAFIPGRRISDNILMAHELVAGYQRDTGKPRCAFKIDLRKAYDTVDWRFLIRMLQGFGFHPVLCRWIEEMLNTSSFSIALNGETVGFFKGARGLRQGDPISPYLFTLVMEGFSMILKQCIEEASNFQYHQGCEEMHITHLCFADDLFVFTSANSESVEVLRRALDMFRTRSGLEPNLAKSEVFFCNVSMDNRQVILNLLPLVTGTFPIRYLGVPLSSMVLRVSDFAPLITRVKTRIHDWKSKFLSFAGRKQLIISVLQSMQLYWMMVFIIPSAIIHELEGLFRDFLWAQGNSSRGRCKVAWETVCKPVHCGGLGFKRLATWNRTLISKQIWDILSRRQTLWVNWIWRFRIVNGSFWTLIPKPSWSWIFRKMLTIRSMVRPFYFYQLGNGHHINAWEDTWFGNTPLSMLISYRRFSRMGFDLHSEARDVIIALNGVWPPEWLSTNPLAFSQQVPILDDTREDVVTWRDGDLLKPEFTVKQAWRSIDGQHQIAVWAKYVWFKHHVSKHGFCMWTACHKRLPTQDRISGWKENPPDLLCPLCNDCPDSHDHLFFTCPYSRDVWRRVKNEVDLWGFPDSWNMILERFQDNQGPSATIQRLALAASIYFIWRERNRRLFRDCKQHVIQTFKVIRNSIMDRMAWRRVVDSIP